MSGVETGRFEEAREIPVAIFPQHTSRNGDPQLHVHILWLNKVKTARDGEWRAIHSPGLYREKGTRGAARSRPSRLARRPRSERRRTRRTRPEGPAARHPWGTHPPARTRGHGRGS